MNDDMKPEYDFSKGKLGAVLPVAYGKERITIRLDKEVLDWFRQHVSDEGGGNYQTMINQALREYIFRDSIHLEEMVRSVVREELAKYRVEGGK